MTNLIKKFSLLDWFVSLACLGYGIATQDWLWIGGGTLGLVIAYFKPAERFKTKLESKLLASKKNNSHDAQAQGVYFSEEVGKSLADEDQQLKENAHYRGGPFVVNQVLLTPSTHNQLTVQAVHGGVPTDRKLY